MIPTPAVVIFYAVGFPVVQTPAFHTTFRLIVEVQVPIIFIFVVHISIHKFSLGLVGAVETCIGVTSDNHFRRSFPADRFKVK